MEGQFIGETAYASTRLSRSQANNIVLQIVDKYEQRLNDKTPPEGKTFQELYDMDCLQPGNEYVELKERVWEELEAMGLKQYLWKR